MGKRNFHWDVVDDCVVTETDQNGNTIVTYTHEPGQFGPLISENRDTGWAGLTIDDWSALSVDDWGSLPVSNPTEYCHHYDALGSTTMLTDETGAVTDTFTYDAWGNVVARTGTTATPYQWVGRWGYQNDAPTGACYVRARSYQPIVARWVSRDPSRLRGLYRNARLSPTQTIDPSGLRSFVSLWSRGGDDEERTYETAFIAVEVTSDESGCKDERCAPCYGNVSFKLHYHAKITGAFVAPPHFVFGLCYNNQFMPFKNVIHQPPVRDSDGYPDRMDLDATIDLPSLKCSGDEKAPVVLVRSGHEPARMLGEWRSSSRRN